MVTSVDICNRALSGIGRQTIINSLTQDSLEAKTANLHYTPITTWCFGLRNWNFARRTAALTSLKTVAAGPPVPWTSASPSPPWTREYSVPANFVRALYLTDSSLNGSTNYVGEPQRFAVSNDTVAAVEQQVILTNIANAVLIFTGFVSDPTLWPWYFERLTVAALTYAFAPAIVGTQEMKRYQEDFNTRFMIADQNNREEGLTFDDTTPEWIQATGINYPFRRDDGKPKLPSRRNPETDR